MSIDQIRPELRTKDKFHHIDMGFLNRRLCITALPSPARDYFLQHQKPGTDHMTVLGNDHLLVTVLLDVCEQLEAPTLLEALTRGKPKQLFRSTERLSACPEIYKAERVRHSVLLDIDFQKPVQMAYHTSHLVSSTGKMTLSEGAEQGYVESIVGLLHDKGDRYEIEPLVIGAPWFDHQRNGDDSSELMWCGRDFGEILPEDIKQFSKMRDVEVEITDDWLTAMKTIPEEDIKNAFAKLLAEPSKKDWGGELNDHFSSSVSIGGRRRTAAFLLKGPSKFAEMTISMCGKQGDQIYRLVNSGADISVVQHCHLIGEAVRATLRSMVVYPGGNHKKYCFIDGKATYRILKAYSFI